MRNLLVCAASVVLILGAGAASADTLRGKIVGIQGGPQRIQLENGDIFKLGTFHTTDQFSKGDQVRIEWIHYVDGYKLAEKVVIEKRK